MSNNIQVTVWCLAYNHEKYIHKTLEGFVAQKTNLKFEVIVHDDASTDGTADIIRVYQEKYPEIIKPILQSENQRQKKINKIDKFLLPNAKGKYIAFCEGDDYWCDDYKLQRQFDCLELHPKVVMCTHKTQCINEDGTKNKKTIPEGMLKSKYLNQDVYSKHLFENHLYPFHTSSYFLRKEILQMTERKELNAYFNGDVAILLTSLIYGDVFYINRIMSQRRLLSIGSWNQWISAQSNEFRAKRSIKIVEGLKKIDDLTKQKYHKNFVLLTYDGLVSAASKYRSDEVKSYLNAYKRENPYKYVNLLSFARYFLYFHCPKLLNILYRQKYKK